LPAGRIEDVRFLDLQHRELAAVHAERRVNAFSLISSAFRAASHSSRDTTLALSIPRVAMIALLFS
jgi:hypothetical protein